MKFQRTTILNIQWISLALLLSINSPSFANDGEEASYNDEGESLGYFEGAENTGLTGGESLEYQDEDEGEGEGLIGESEVYENVSENYGEE